MPMVLQFSNHCNLISVSLLMRWAGMPISSPRSLSRLEFELLLAPITSNNSTFLANSRTAFCRFVVA